MTVAARKRLQARKFQWGPTDLEVVAGPPEQEPADFRRPFEEAKVKRQGGKFASKDGPGAAPSGAPPRAEVSPRVKRAADDGKKALQAAVSAEYERLKDEARAVLEQLGVDVPESAAEEADEAADAKKAEREAKGTKQAVGTKAKEGSTKASPKERKGSTSKKPSKTPASGATSPAAGSGGGSAAAPSTAKLRQRVIEIRAEIDALQRYAQAHGVSLRAPSDLAADALCDYYDFRGRYDPLQLRDSWGRWTESGGGLAVGSPVWVLPTPKHPNKKSGRVLSDDGDSVKVRLSGTGGKKVTVPKSQLAPREADGPAPAKAPPPKPAKAPTAKPAKAPSAKPGVDSSALPNTKVELGALPADVAGRIVADLADMRSRYPVAFDATIKKVATYGPGGGPKTAYASYGAGTINVSPTKFASAAKVEASLKSDVAVGFHPPGTDKLEAVITHEAGHAIWEHLKVNAPKVMPEEWKALREARPIKYTKTGKGSGTQSWSYEKLGEERAPSKYALEAPYEFWAEAFSSAHHTPPEKQTPYVKKLAAFLEEYSKKEKGAP